MPELASARDALERVGQDHLLAFADRLGADELAGLLAQIDSLDLEALPSWIDEYVRHKPVFELPSGVEPAPYYPLDDTAEFRPWDRGAMRRAGEELVRAGKVAAFTVAGGQGTRLGYDGPKGCYPAGAVTGKPLFAVFAEYLQAIESKYGVAPPWYVMTSPLNHEPTVAFFKENSHFGLDPKAVRFFPQGVMPSFDMESAKILLADHGSLATNPDGHGGAFTALAKSGALEDMGVRGVEHVSYFQVDNPVVRPIDPAFIGLHASAPDSSAEMSSKMLAKAYPEEKVGVFCRVDGRTTVIEYSDLPMELQRERLEDGRLRFISGSPAMHVMSLAFIDAVTSNPDYALPFHRAEKKVPHVDLETGERVEPTEANGVKLERFVFDAVPLCRESVVMEVDRTEEFAPIKNKTGVDSAESSARIQTERAARWLSAVGVKIPRRDDGSPDCTIELSPLTAMEASDLKGRDLPAAIEPGAAVAL